MRRALLVSGAIAVSSLAHAPASGATREPLLHRYEALTLAPDGSRLADLESDDPAVDGTPVHSSLVIRRTTIGTPIEVRLPCGTSPDCEPSSPAWSPDGRRLAYVLQAPNAKTRTIESVDANGNAPKRLLGFAGTLDDLRYARDGSLTVLATANARKKAGATQVGADIAGEIGARPDEQRIAHVIAGALHWASPPNLYVYEYDPIPHGGFVGTAAPGDGDNNWWIAKLYAFSTAGAPRVVYAPATPAQQLAHPRVSPRGDLVAFVGGIMSDFGSTGGDAYVVPLERSRTNAARNVTPQLDGSVTSLAWNCAGARVVTTELRGAELAIVSRDPRGVLDANAFTLWHGRESLAAADETLGASCSAPAVATIHQSFTKAPEIAFGSLGAWHDITHRNADAHVAAHARSIAWRNDGYRVRGWLLTPAAPAAAGKRALVTVIHGGPSAAYEPRFIGRGTVRSLLARGYDVFEPNPRGSYGSGEAFTAANVKDFGYGDLRDIMTGIDTVEKAAPVDEARLGIMGYSYGGYMTMWAVTQTRRFKAAVAGAGVSDWLSYYGENGIDRWMIPFFGASVYDDPAVYAKSAPMTFVKNVRTPTFEYVGDHDVECPMPQTQEFWHALHTLRVPTSFVVYPHEGHGLHDPRNRADANRRTLAWFDRYLKR